jgi:hypothetical protein
MGILKTIETQHRFDELLDQSGPVVQFANQVDGNSAEAKFEEAWKRSHPWIKRVEKTTDPIEDRHNHVDFMLLLACDNFRLPVDVKASEHALEAFLETHRHRNDLPAFVIADFNASLDEVRRRTIKAVVQWLTDKKLRALLKRLPQRPSLH